MECSLPRPPLFTEFSRQEYWSRLPFPSPGDLLDAGIQPASSALAGGFFTTGATWKVSPFKMHMLMLPVLCNPQGLWILLETSISGHPHCSFRRGSHLWTSISPLPPMEKKTKNNGLRQLHMLSHHVPSEVVSWLSEHHKSSPQEEVHGSWRRAAPL